MPTIPTTPRLSLLVLSLIKMSTASGHRSRLLLAACDHRCAFSSLRDAERTPACLSIRAEFLPESTWRREAESHARRIRDLLSPGTIGARSSLDPRHPIYNFLVEYYGIKGSKGVRRLTRWCPPPPAWRSCRDSMSEGNLIELEVSLSGEGAWEEASASASSAMAAGVFLENASMQDIASGTLHLRGATFIHQEKKHSADQVAGILYCPKLYFGQKHGDLACGTKCTGDNNASRMPHEAASAFLWYRTLLKNTLRSDPILYCHGMHEWAMLYNPDPSSTPPPSGKYQSHLSLRIPQCVINEQVERKGVRCTHIDALRFFAPEARKWNWYGSLEDLSQEERACGTVAKRNVEEHLSSARDATSRPRDDDDPRSMRRSASTVLTRTDQLHLEQKACLHANMDLFKIAWRLQPFVSSTLLTEALAVALQARTLDVEASPYDVTGYHGLCWSHDVNVAESGEIGVPCGTMPLGAVEVETEEGRKEYRRRQAQVMQRGEVVRKKLVRAYSDFLMEVFGIEEDESGEFYDAVRGQKIQSFNTEQVMNCDALQSR
ncbi:hypothetical protein ACHAWX_002494 [Stephanocyclus meneghinianus]